jgi:hypothetical protein
MIFRCCSKDFRVKSMIQAYFVNMVDIKALFA